MRRFERVLRPAETGQGGLRVRYLKELSIEDLDELLERFPTFRLGMAEGR